jgi:hypothetical protein
MKFISMVIYATYAATVSAYIIAAPVYAVKRNIDAKPRAMRAREEQLRRRLQSRSRTQKVLDRGIFDLDDYRDEHGVLDLCEVSNCEITGEVMDEEVVGDSDYDLFEGLRITDLDPSIPLRVCTYSA